MADSLILMVLALVVFGPRRLPQIGRQIGKLMFEFRKASNDFKFQMEEELRAAEEADRRKKEEAERQRVAALAAESQASVSAPAQTIESTADIGAVEPSTTSGYPEQYPPETAATEAAPAIQPPQTGEQVSASPPFSAALEQAVSEVNPDADVAANAEEFAATGFLGTGREPAAEAVPTSDIAPPTSRNQPSDQDLSPGTPNHPSDQDLSPGTPNHPIDQDQSPGTPKEPASQHG